MDAEIKTRQILIEDMIVAVVTAIEALQINQKKISDFNGIRSNPNKTVNQSWTMSDTSPTSKCLHFDEKIKTEMIRVTCTQY